MKVVDANVLLYAVNSADERHDAARGWLDGALSRGETVGFSWLALLAFVRLSTHHAVFPNPLDVSDAMARVRAWVDQPSAVIVEATARHLDVLGGLLDGLGAGGNLVSDAHLAALAIEHGATIVTYDNDFARFAGVRWERPVA